MFCSCKISHFISLNIDYRLKCFVLQSRVRPNEWQNSRTLCTGNSKHHGCSSTSCFWQKFRSTDDFRLRRGYFEYHESNFPHHPSFFVVNENVKLNLPFCFQKMLLTSNFNPGNQVSFPNYFPRPPFSVLLNNNFNNTFVYVESSASFFY